MALLIAQFVVLMAATVAGRLVFVNPDPSNMLQQLLCNSSTDFNDTTLLLSTSGVHTMLPTGSLCLIQYASNLTITAEPLSDSPATIHCRSEPVNGIASSGFALVFGSGIRISNLVFRNCGEKVSTVETRSSSFDQSTRAALLIVDSKSVILSNVTIYSWYGYGLLCINIAGRSSFNYLIVTNGSNAKSQSRGSGVAIVYNQKLTADSTVQVTNSRFYGNQDHLDNALSDWPTFKFVPLNISNIPGAGGLTVLVQDVSTAMINVTVSNSIFTRNTGPIAGGAAVLVYNSSSVLFILFQSCVFEANFGDEFGTKTGSGFSAYFNDASCSDCTELDNILLSFKDTIFRNHFHRSAIFITSSNILRRSSILLQNITCSNNSANANGHCIYAISSSPTNMVVSIENMLVSYNGKDHMEKSKAVLAFVNISSVSITGALDSGFSASNNYGSVFYCLLSNLYLSGFLEFNNNTAMYGPAMYLDYSSFVYLSQLLSANFNNNTADINGGAIYAVLLLNSRNPLRYKLLSKQ